MTNHATAETAAITASATKGSRWRSRYQGTRLGDSGVCSRLLGSTVVAILVPHRVRLCPHAPGVTRTRGQQFRKLLLYPSELRGLHTCKIMRYDPNLTH